MTTASLGRRWREGGGGLEESRRRERRTGGAGRPELDLDLVEVEAEEEQKETRWRREEEEEEKSRRRRRRKEEEEKKERGRQGGRSRSLPRNGASSWDSSLPEETRGGETERRRRSHTVSHHAKHHGSSAAAPQAVFSFLMPMSHDKPSSDSESAASFSDISQSAASVVRLGMETSDWRRAALSREQENGPGVWLKPSPHRLTRVLTGSRLSGRGLAGGLSL